MPKVSLPFSKGLAVSPDESDWVDALPVNMLAVPKPVLDAQGYMRSFAGVVQKGTAGTSGTSRGGVYNPVEDVTYRVIGAKLYRIVSTTTNGSITLAISDVVNLDTSEVEDDGNYVIMDYSEVSLAFLHNKIIRYWDTTIDVPDSPENVQDLPVLKDWDKNEYEPVSANLKWYFNLYKNGNDENYATFDSFNGVSTENSTIKLSLLITQLPTSTIRILGGSNATEGVFLKSDGHIVAIQDAANPSTEITFIGQFTSSNLNTFVDFQGDNIAEFKNGGLNQMRLNANFDHILVESLLLQTIFLNINRLYPTISTSISPPTTTEIPNFGTDLTVLTLHRNTISTTSENLWSQITSTTPASLKDGTHYSGIVAGTFDDVVDFCRNDDRYIWIRENNEYLYVTNNRGNPTEAEKKLDEQRPDYMSPFVRVALHATYPTSINSWRGYVVATTKHTTEYFGLTGDPNNIYQRIPSLTVQCGCISPTAICEFKDNFVVLGSPLDEPLSVYYLAHGDYTELADRLVQQYIREYTEAELEVVLIEPFKYDGHDGFILHLPNQTLLYDPMVKGAQWHLLTSGSQVSDGYNGIDFTFDAKANKWMIARKDNNQVGLLDWQTAEFFGEDQYFALYTPMIQARNKRLKDFEVDSSANGLASNVTMHLNSTFDGLNYNVDTLGTRFSMPVSLDARILKRDLGYSRNNIGFRLDWTTSYPVTISNFRIRVE